MSQEKDSVWSEADYLDDCGDAFFVVFPCWEFQCQVHPVVWIGHGRMHLACTEWPRIETKDYADPIVYLMLVPMSDVFEDLHVRHCEIRSSHGKYA